MAKARTGTMRERRPGVWQLIVSLERQQRLVDSLTKMARLGERIIAKRERLYATVYGTEAEARSRLAAMQAESEADQPVAGTLAAMFEDWQRAESYRWKSGTTVKYRGLAKHILPFM